MSSQPLTYLLPLLLSFLLASITSIASSIKPLRFLNNAYNVTIYENSLAWTYVAGTELMGVSLSDIEFSDQLTFLIVSGDVDGFFVAETVEVGGVAVLRIRTRTGQRDVLNRERRNSYNLVVEARLGATVAATNVTVFVLDTNDNIPLFYPTAYQVSIGEDAALHTPLLAVTAHDADSGMNGQLYYYLEDHESNLFAIHPTTGVLSVTRPLSRIYSHLHNVNVLARDRGPRPPNQRGAARATVEVEVYKVNLHSPHIRVQQLPHVVEHSHTHIYAIITVDDPDDGDSGVVEHVDVIGGDPDNLFSITHGSQPDEYNLAVLKFLDRELAPSGYNLTLQAIDKGTPPRSSRVNVRVNIADVNDQAPVFAKEQYEEAVSEEAPPNTPVVRVAASDTDQGINGRVRFRLVAGNEGSKFSINPITGIISTAAWLDHEEKADYSLTVAAVDQATDTRRKQSSAKVIIRVIDANDNAPEFSTPNTEVTLDENEPIGTYVTRMIATDEDAGENGFISYSIDNLDQVPFMIDPFDGTIRTNLVLDYEAQRRVYTIKVRAADWGTPFKRETETTVKVKVRDVNDNRPQFEGVDCKGWVDVDAAVGTSVLSLKAVDLDEGSSVNYQLHNDMDEECWAIDGSSGVLALTCDLSELIPDDEKQRTYILNVTANDGSHVSDPTTITIMIVSKRNQEQNRLHQDSHVECHKTNVRSKVEEIVAVAAENNAAEEHYALLPLRYGFNSHSPELPDKFPSKLRVREDAEIGTQLLTVTATDHDRGYNGRVVYALSSGDTDSVFRIGVHSGILELVAKLDRERTPEYTLNLTVYDLGVPHRSVSINLTISVVDVNDNAPEFSRVSYSLHLPENTRNGTSVAQLSAQDSDSGLNAQVTYELVTDVDDFTVDRITGKIYMVGSLDRERRDEYDLRVRAWDSAPENPSSALARVLVTVLDINDCAPEFGAARSLAIDIPEDLPKGAVVATLQATDQDLGLGGHLTYSLMSGHKDSFRIDEETGVVRLSEPLDYETRPTYNITVCAKDGGSPALEALATLFIRVHDVDENLGPPVFIERVVRAWVQENMDPGAHVTNLTARDPDGGQLSYTITGGDGLGYFSIDNRGVIRSLVVLDREASRGYWLTVMVSDNGAIPLSDTCHVWVEIEDVNDHIPQTDEPAYHIYVAENLPPHSHVVTLHASDPDISPAHITFSFTRGNHLDHLAINSNTGEIRTQVPLDREQLDQYELWVQISDGQLSSTTPVFLSVTDTNDNAPEFLESLYRVTVPAKSRTRRRDAPPLFRFAPDDETGGDSWGEWQSFVPSEITARDDSLLRVFARDADVGINGDIDYSIKTSKGKKGKFKIHPKTGQIYTNKALTPGKTFDLMVQAKDKGQPQLMATTRVLIRVAQIPQNSPNPPVISPLPPTHVMETDPPGHMVAFLTAHDPDNDTLWYYITDGDASGRFSMGVDTGLVTLARHLDYEDQYRYSLTITATDGVHTTATKLVVVVMDANDHRPVFNAPVYEANVSEDAAPGTSVLSLQCRDRDQSPSAVYFNLHHSHALASNGLFSLDSTTGDLLVAQPLDREVCSIHELTVSCRDRGRRENADFARILVTVTDANDHRPTFLESTITAKVSVGAAAGTAVTRVLAVDLDKGDNGRLSYSIVEGNSGGTFSMDATLGVISLTRELAGPKPSEYLLLVRATDHARVAREASVPVTILVTSWQSAPPVWPNLGNGQVVEVSEWANVGTAVVHLSAQSTSPLHYALTAGDTSNIFAISPASGVVTLARRLDYETCAWYNLSLTATSLSGLKRSTWFGVRVLDENDWWPQWEFLTYHGTVLATASPGSPVLATSVHTHTHQPAPLTLTAFDQDQGHNGRVSYSIVEKHIGKFFTIDEFTGAVRVSGDLEEVSGEDIELSVWATDGGDPKRECVAPAAVIISVKSVKLPPDAFTQAHFSATLYLPTFPGVRVVCPAREDGEGSFRKGGFQNLIYSIIEGDDGDEFTFDPESRCIIVKDQLNLKPHYNLTIQAVDGSGGSLSSLNSASTNATVQISIQESPVSTLIFTKDKYLANVEENTTKEMNVVALGIRGQPINHHVHYSLLNPSNLFVIHPTAGVIKTTGIPFDREAQDHYTLVVQAQEEDEADNLAHVLVHVAVKDVNDNEPIFVNQPYLALVPTTAATGHIITKVRALDMDDGSFGNVRYELVRGSGELFSVNKKSGEISLKQPVMVADKTYSLTVAAYDGGQPPLSSQAHVMIRVVSADGPLFSAGRYEASVSEDATEGTPVVRVEAASPSGKAIMYTIVAGNTQHLFSIDFATGVVQTAAPLDYEVSKGHNLTIRARDPMTGTHTDTHISISVTDVNDNPPEFTRPIYKSQVSEVAGYGHMVLQVSALDVDTGAGGQVRYSCGDGCDKFGVRSHDGVVSVTGKLDRETEDQHTLTVVATDSGIPPLSSSATIIIRVLDFNDNPPSWRQDSYSCRVSSEAQPGHIVTAISAHDPDIGQLTPLTYHIHSGDQHGIFRVDPLTGVVIVTAPHKLANTTSLNLNMSVSDGVHVVFTGLHVSVVPSNHFTPRFSQPLYEVAVMENSQPDQLVLTLEAFDPDAAGYGSFKFDILHQTSETAFRVDKEGNIYTTSPLDRETIMQHSMKVSVTDEGGRGSFAEVRISVLDKNDNPPVFTLREYQGNINTDAASGTTILKVDASDMDEGKNSKVEYSMYEANSSEALTLFKVNKSTGHITLIRSARGLENEVYQFFIRAEDEGSPRHHADVPVTIFLLPLNDPPPQCQRQYAQFFLWEDAPVGKIVTSLWTEGPQKVQYSIQSDETDDGGQSGGSFAVTDDGHVVVRQALDHERRGTHRITVTNQTLATPPALDYMTISVVVMDVNDCTPHFSAASYKAVVAENSEVGSTVTILTATDDDEGNNGRVQYSFAPDEDIEVKSTFSIDPHSGQVTLASALDRETKARYSFSVVATDGGPEPLSSSARVIVVVQDYNDNPPVFTRDSYITAVPEDTATGTAVVELSVRDADHIKTPLDYFVSGGDSDGHFLVHTSGQVYVADTLDREKQAEYTLTVTATDGKFTSNTTVTVTVIDVNDNGPVCQEPLYRREISEGVSAGTHVTSVVAWDADEGAASRSRYSLTGDGAEHFTIDQLSGHVSTAMQLDRETINFYQLTVVVSDWEESSWQCEVELDIIITDINDNPPSFTEESHTATLPEDSPVNTVLLKMQATDPDLGTNRQVRYNLVDSADGHFTIDEAEGVVSLARPLDRETKDSYSLTVQAMDHGIPPLSSTTQLTVIVSDINDNAPEFIRKLHETTVAENTIVGTEVLRVMATSKDIGINAEISYSLQHTTRIEYLHIHPKTGVISIGLPVDYERVQQVVATVIATDGGKPPLSATALVNVTITDVNDNSPVFTLPTFTASVREDALQGSSVVQVSASDIDSGVNSLVRYSIVDGNDDRCFSIDEHSGIVTLIATLDREKVAYYHLRIGARDLGTPSNTAMTQLEVTVQDVNDNSPVFTQQQYSVIVQENRGVGSSLIRLMATDADADPNGAPFTWELINPAIGTPAFTLAQDGSLKLATNKLDHRAQDMYTVQVRVWDSGSPPMNADTFVNVKVVEESRYPPTLFPLNTVIINYRKPFPGGIIGKVTALDQDPYDTLQYSIAPYPQQISSIKYFDVDAQDGTLVSLKPLDSGNYSVNVSVSDGRFHRAVEVNIQVSVITHEMVQNSVIVHIGPLSSDDFLTRYRKIFIQAVANELNVESTAVIFVSLQPSLVHSDSMETIYGTKRSKRDIYSDLKQYKKDIYSDSLDNIYSDSMYNIYDSKRSKRDIDFDATENISKRSKRDIQRSLDLLFVVKKPDGYVSRNDLLNMMKSREASIKSHIDLPLLAVMDSMCTVENTCSGHGVCTDVIDIIDDVAVPFNTQLSSLVAPGFTQKAGCVCEQGYGGNECDTLVNECGHRPCAEYEECRPSNTSSRGYTCQCPKGRAGPLCQVDLTRCRHPSCHYPLRPLSFTGKSYAQYSVAQQDESSSLVLSAFLRTRNPVGTIVYSGGDVDYSILEVVGGHVQYRWDCGSGEGLVRVSTVKVDNDEWHFINLTREGTISTLSVNGEISSGAAPGANDVLNMDSDSIYLGAKMNPDATGASSSFSQASLGFIGCLDQVTISGVELPVAMTGSSSSSAVLKRLANVELQCPSLLPIPGVCGSYPCLNGGTCISSVNGKSYKCTCSSRFSGPQCQIDTAPCSSSPCLNGGKCIVVGHSYKCNCPLKLSGKRCEYGRYCNPNPCENGGRCEEGADGHMCKCQHFTGAMCQLDIDECTRNPCQNSGTCLNFYGGFKCICPSSVTGEYCTEPLFKQPPPSTSLNLTMEELLCVLAVFFGFIVAALLVVAWQRRRCRTKRHHQNNTINLTDYHVKNDLKANDIHKRNSKICNVEADQGPPLPPRPASYTPSGTDSVLFNTLKQLADLSAAGHENLELDSLSHEFLHSLNKPVASPPSLSPPPPQLKSDSDPRKPWDHHNNLNDSYFMPIKDVGCDLVTNLGDQRPSPGHQSPSSEDSSVCSRGTVPPTVPPLPSAHLLGRRGTPHHSPPLEVMATGSESPEGVSIQGEAAITTDDTSVLGGHGTPQKHSDPNISPTQQPRKGYHWDHWDLRGSRLLNTDNNTPDLLRLTPSMTRPPPDSADLPYEACPLLAGGKERVRSAGRNVADAATPLLSMDARDSQELHEDDEEDDDDDPCSFEEILLANNIALDSPNQSNYNIVSDIEEDLCPTRGKTSNLDGLNNLAGDQSPVSNICELEDEEEITPESSLLNSAHSIAPSPSKSINSAHSFAPSPSKSINSARSIAPSPSKSINSARSVAPSPSKSINSAHSLAPSPSNSAHSIAPSPSKSINSAHSISLSPSNSIRSITPSASNSARPITPTSNSASADPSTAMKVDNNRLGSPRSRRPFHRRDYSRVSDVSFLSALDDEGVDESFSEPPDSDWEIESVDPQGAALIQTSPSEVYL